MRDAVRAVSRAVGISAGATAASSVALGHRLAAPSEQQTNVKINCEYAPGRQGAGVHAGLTRDRDRAPERCGADDAGIVAQLGHDEAQVGRRLEHPR